MKTGITVERTGNPTPNRDWDWAAYFDFNEDDENRITGLGASESEAVLDLLNSVSVSDDGRFYEALCGMAFAYWQSHIGCKA